MKRNDKLSLFDVVDLDRLAKLLLSIDNSLTIMSDSIAGISDSLATIADHMIEGKAGSNEIDKTTESK